MRRCCPNLGRDEISPAEVLGEHVALTSTGQEVRQQDGPSRRRLRVVDRLCRAPQRLICALMCMPISGISKIRGVCDVLAEIVRRCFTEGEMKAKYVN